MDDINRSQGDPEQCPDNQPQGKEFDQTDINPEAGQTYWEAGNAEPGQTYWEAGNAEPEQTLWQDSNSPEVNNQDMNGEELYQQTFSQNQAVHMESQPNYIQNDSFGPGYYNPQPQEDLPKRKSHGKLIAAIVTIIIIAAGATLTYANQKLVRNTLALLTKSPAEYYAYVEKNSIEDAVNLMMAINKNKVINEDIAVQSSVALTYDKETVNSLLQTYIGMTMEDLEAGIGLPLESIGFDSLTALKKDNLYTEFGVSLNQIELLSFQLFMDRIKKEMLVAIPDLSPAYLRQSFDPAKLGEDAVNFNFESYLDNMELLYSDKLGDSIKRYGFLIADGIENVTISKGEDLTVGDITMKANVLTAVIDGDDMIRIAGDIITEAKEDEFILELLPPLGVTKEDYLEAIAEAEASLAAAKDDGQSIEIKVYVDNTGRILGREITALQDGNFLGSLGFSLVNEGAKAEYVFFIKDETGNAILNAEGNQTTESGTTDGEVIIDISHEAGAPFATNLSIAVEYDDVRMELKDDRTYHYGSYTVTTPVLPGMALGLDLDAEGDVQKAAIAFRMGGTDLVTLDMRSEYLNNFEIPEPSATAERIDISDINSFAATVDTEKFIHGLSDKLGVDLESLFNGILSGYMY